MNGPGWKVWLTKSYTNRFFWLRRTVMVWLQCPIEGLHKERCCPGGGIFFLCMHFG